MANLAYARFQNTLSDLRDCSEHMDDQLNGEELKARDALISLCREIVEDYGDGETDEDPLEDWQLRGESE
jgi:hypothetical protein